MVSLKCFILECLCYITLHFLLILKSVPNFRHTYKKTIKNNGQTCPQLKVLHGFVSIHILIFALYLCLSVCATCVCLCSATYTHEPST